MLPLGTSIIDLFFIGLFVVVFGYIIYYNVTEIRSARKRLREAERNRTKS
jgi:hypothetical protein